MLYEVKGFPDVSESIEMPNIGELLVSPIFSFASAEDIHKYGNDTLRYFLDKTPLKHDRKYVLVTSTIQFLTPDVRTIANHVKEEGNDWHLDATSLDPDKCDRFHNLFSECSALTEFNEKPFSIDIEKCTGWGINNYVSEHEDELPLVAKKAPANAFITFTTHLHKRSTPRGNEFRYWFRVVETNDMQPKSHPQRNMSIVSGINGLGKNVVSIPSVEQQNDKIIIHVNRGNF